MWGTPKSRALAAFTASAVLAGCGGGGAAGEDSPARIVPPDALVYTEVTVRPEGSLREDALDAAGKVLATDDPEATIRELVDRAFEDGEVDYARDVEPWLGERAGVWLSPTQDTGLVVLAATDTDEARSSIEAALKRSGPVTERSHGGREYLLNGDEEAVGVIDDFVVFGPEADYRRAIDAAEGDSLAETDEYADAIDALGDDERLAQFWIDLPALIERAQGMHELSSLIPLDSVGPLAGSFTANGDALAVEVRLRGAPMRVASTPLLQELPGDSWAAFGSEDVGESLRTTIDNLGGAIGGLVIRRQVHDETGLDLDRDLLDWIGNVGVFVRGATGDTIDGGVVIQPTDEDKAANAFGRIVGAAQVKAEVRAQPVDVAGADQAFELRKAGSPRPIVLARGSGLVVVTAGRDAAEAALASGDRLGDTDLYSEAQDLVGMEPGALVSMPALIELIGAWEPEVEEYREYLEPYSVVAVGSVTDGDETIGRVAAGLK